eukprot:2124862-Alexandrium_andersonii.AAC.1
MQGLVAHAAVRGKWKLIAEMPVNKHADHRALMQKLSQTAVQGRMSKVGVQALLKDRFCEILIEEFRGRCMSRTA